MDIEQDNRRCMNREIAEGCREIFYWQYDNTNSFKNRLCTLMQIADHENFRRLKKVYPGLAEAFQMWMNAPSQGEFFEKNTPELWEERFGSKKIDEQNA